MHSQRCPIQMLPSSGISEIVNCYELRAKKADIAFTPMSAMDKVRARREEGTGAHMSATRRRAEARFMSDSFHPIYNPGWSRS